MADSAPDHESAPPRRKRNLSWPAALAFWVFVSLLGWVAIVGVVASLGTGDLNQVADENDTTENDLLPAAGPDSDGPPADAPTEPSAR